MGSPGLDELRWLRPVRPGDTLRSEVEVVEARPSRSKPDRGILVMAFRIRNQRDEDVLAMRTMQLTRRRAPHSAPAGNAVHRQAFAQSSGGLACARAADIAVINQARCVNCSSSWTELLSGRPLLLRKTAAAKPGLE
jgi:hypothetical protein